MNLVLLLVVSALIFVMVATMTRSLLQGLGTAILFFLGGPRVVERVRRRKSRR